MANKFDNTELVHSHEFQVNSEAPNSTSTECYKFEMYMRPDGHRIHVLYYRPNEEHPWAIDRQWEMKD